MEGKTKSKAIIRSNYLPKWPVARSNSTPRYVYVARCTIRGKHRFIFAVGALSRRNVRLSIEQLHGYATTRDDVSSNRRETRPRARIAEATSLVGY